MKNTTLPKWLATALVVTTVSYPLAGAVQAQADASASVAASTPFSDMAGVESAFQKAVQEAVQVGWVDGDLNGAFRPYDALTRQELAKLLAAAMKLPVDPAARTTFADVSADRWSLPYIEAVRKAGLMEGDGADRFRPADPITREELSAVLVRALKLQPAADAARLVVTDKASINQWAEGYVARTLERGLLHADKAFGPRATLKRMEIAEVLLHALTPDHPTDYLLDSIHGREAWINGVAFTISSALEGLFQESNHAVLQGARLTYEADDNAELQSIKDLTLTRSGSPAAPDAPEFSGNLVLDGQGAALAGKLTVEADYVSVKHLLVDGDLELSKKLENDFYMEDVSVAGRTIVNGGDTNTVVFSNSQLGQVDVNKTNVRVEALGTTSVQSMTVTSSASIHGSDTASIQQVTLADGASQVSLDAAVESVTVSSSKPVSLTGSGAIGTLTVQTTAPVQLNNQGSVSNLNVATPAASLTLGTGIKVGNLALPAGVTGNAVIANYSTSISQISQVNGTPVPPSNRAPIIAAAPTDQTIQLTGGPVTLDLSGVFTDPENDSITITAVSRSKSVATVQMEGKLLTLTPVSGGSSIIQLSGSDGRLFGSARFTLYVNTAPEALTVPKQVVTVGNAPLTLDQAALFRDADKDAVTYTAVSSDPGLATASVTGGVLTIGAVREGDATITLTASDGRGGTTTNVLDVHVNRKPQAAFSIPDQLGTVGNPDVTLSLSNYFTDPDGDSLSYEAVSSDPAQAAAAVEGGTLRLTPKAVGTPTITVKALDGQGGIVTGSFTLTVNRAPAAGTLSDQTLTLGEAPYTLDLNGVYTDLDQDTLSFSAVSSDPAVASAQLANGLLTVSALQAGNATMTVTAEDGRGGRTVRSFQAFVNRKPASVTAIPSQTTTILGGKTVLQLSDFWMDPDNDALSYTASVADPALLSAAIVSGRLELEGYLPGSTTVDLTVRDGRGGEQTSSIPVLVNRSPVVIGQMSKAEQWVTVGSPLTLSLTDRFADYDNDAITLRAQSSNTSLLTAAMAGDELTLTALSGSQDTVTVTVTAEDGKGGSSQVEIPVRINAAPAASLPEWTSLQDGGPDVLLNLADLFTDSDGDALSVTVINGDEAIASAQVLGDQLVLTPGSAGSTTVSLTAEDGHGGTTTRTMTVYVNRAPTVASQPADQTVTIGAGPLTVDLSSSFQDPDNDAWTLEALVQDPSLAQVQVNRHDVQVTGLAPGQSTVQLTVSDGKGGTVTSSFNLLVNQAPTLTLAPEDQYTTLGTGDVSVDLSQAFADGDGDALTLEAVSLNPAVASVALSGTQLTLSTVDGGTATIQVTARDGKGGQNQITFKLEVNRSPIALTIPVQTVVLERGEQVLDLSPWISDADGDALTVTAVTSDAAVAGAAATGTQLTVQPLAIGQTSITLTVDDGKGGVTNRTFSVQVEANEAPVVSTTLADQRVAVGNSIQLDASTAFLDANGDALTYTASSSDETVATVSIAGSALTVNGLADGTVTVTVTATDGIAAPVSTTFNVEASSNQAPTVAATLPLQVVGAGVTANTFSVASLFQDPDGNPLTYTVTAADGAKVTATVDGDQLTLTGGSAYGPTTVTVSANDGKGGTVSTDLQVLSVNVVKNQKITTKQGVSSVSYDLSAALPNQTSFTQYGQVKGGLTQSSTPLAGTRFQAPVGAVGSTTGYWIVGANNSAVFLEVTVEAQVGAGAFFSEYTAGPDGRIAVEIYNKSESTINYQMVGYRYNTATGQMEVMKNRDITPLPYNDLYQIYPGTAGLIINHTFYDLFDISNAPYYHGEFDMTGTGGTSYVICAFELLMNGQVIDVIGDKTWSPANGGAPLPSNTTLIRKQGIGKGSSTYNAHGEWDILPPTYANLVTHTP